MAKLTARISVSITPAQHQAIEKEALKRRRSFSDMVRILLMEALDVNLSEGDDDRHEFEIALEPTEVDKLKELGYKLSPLNQYRQMELSI